MSNTNPVFERTRQLDLAELLEVFRQRAALIRRVCGYKDRYNDERNKFKTSHPSSSLCAILKLKVEVEG